MIYWLPSAPWAKCSLLVSPLLPRSIILCVLPHLQRKMVAGLPTAMTDGSLCVRMLLCLFSTSLFLRGVSAKHDQYSGIVLPPHLIQWDPQGWGVKALIGQREEVSFSCIRHTQGQSAWGIWKMHHHASTLAQRMVEDPSVRWPQYGSLLTFQPLALLWKGKSAPACLNAKSTFEFEYQFGPWQRPGQASLISLLDKQWG